MTIITAIPMNDDHIAGHFAKAERFVFVDEQGSTLAEIANPVAGNECKSALAELLQAQGARRIVLKNIGSKMLGKLLGSGLAVYQASQGRLAMADMLSNESGNLTELTSAEQGSASRCAEGGRPSRQGKPPMRSPWPPWQRGLLQVSLRTTAGLSG